MHYRPFGTTGFDVSALGFGTMRLPLTGDNPADIDRRQAIRMIQSAVDYYGGVRYELPAELAFASTQELLNQWVSGLAAT